MLIRLIVCFFLLVTIDNSFAQNISILERPQVTIDTAEREGPGKMLIKAARVVSFKTSSADRTRLNLSPDGKKFVFEILGDLYVLPVTGGEAIQLTRGLPNDRNAIWSPNGKLIAYISDARAGVDEVWVMNSDGTNPFPLGELNWKDDRLDTWIDKNPPEWTADCKSVVVGDVIFDLNGEIRHSQYQTSPRFSADGKYIYFIRNGLQKYDIKTGTTTELGNVGPDFYVSPDGQWVFSKYVIRNLLTGELKSIKPLQGAKGRISVTFSPDSKFIFFVNDRKIYKVDINASQVGEISFFANVKVDIGKRVYHPLKIDNDSLFEVKYLRSPILSPDGKNLLFTALRKIYKKDLITGKTTILARQNTGQFHPTYSPDGQWIAYVTWDDQNGGSVWRVSSLGGMPQRLTTEPGRYVQPSWSIDGGKLAFINLSSSDHSSIEDRGVSGILYVMKLGSSAKALVSGVSGEAAPTFTMDGKRILYQEFDLGTSGPIVLYSIELDGKNRYEIARTTYYNGHGSKISPSADERFVIHGDSKQHYLTKLHPTDKSKNLLGNTIKSPLPTVRLVPGLDPNWGVDNKTITWISGREVYLMDAGTAIEKCKVRKASVLADTLLSEPDMTSAPRSYPDTILNVVAYQKRNLPVGAIVLRGAKIISMKGDEVIDNGVIVIINDRIAAIGQNGETKIPTGAKIFDVQGKTIIPGFIDMHAHFSTQYYNNFIEDRSGIKSGLAASLAYGVTSAREVSGSVTQLEIGERIEAGDVIGPRFIGDGHNLQYISKRGEWYGALIESLEDARLYVNNLVRMGAGVIKYYDQPTRRRRQWILQASDEAGMNVTGHYYFDLILDGFTGWEHIQGSMENPNHLQLVAGAKIWWTPTFAVQGGSNNPNLGSLDYIYKSAKYQRFTTEKVQNDPNKYTGNNNNPRDRDVLQFRSYVNAAAHVIKMGGNLGAGSHGIEYPGAGMHYELWHLQYGGLTPHQALRIGTLGGAEGLGSQKDLGSLEVGKIADLLILDKNPLDNIQNTLSIRYVMKNGELYDGNTLDVIWPKMKKFPIEED